MSQRRNTAFVECPLIFMHTESGLPERTIARIPDRRRSWSRTPAYPALRVAVRHCLLNSRNLLVPRSHRRRRPDVPRLELPRHLPSIGRVHCQDLERRETSDSPVEQPVKFDLLVNLETAKALGLTIPQSVLVLADRVIQ